MTGRLSMEKAKAIKAQRELAKELEDVIEYEKEKGMSAGTRRAAAEARKNMVLPDEESEDEEEDEEVVTRRNKTADLFAFIGDQSSDED